MTGARGPAHPWARLGRDGVGPHSPSWHPAGRWVTLPERGAGSLRVHVVTLGQGPDLLLLHGFAQSSWAWRFNLERLGQHLRVHAVCVPGFGWSAKPPAANWRLGAQAERMAALLDALGIGRAHLVGNSLGAALALQLCLLRPEAIDKLVLVNPAGPGLYPVAMAAALQHPALAPLLALPTVPWGLRLGLRHVAYRKLTIDDGYMERFLQPLRGPDAARVALSVARHYVPDLRALRGRLPEVTRPCLIIDGAADRVLPRRTVAATGERLSQARTVTFAHSGHCPMEEEPARFNQAVVAFLGAPDPPAR